MADKKDKDAIEQLGEAVDEMFSELNKGIDLLMDGKDSAFQRMFKKLETVIPQAAKKQEAPAPAAPSSINEWTEDDVAKVHAIASLLGVKVLDRRAALNLIRLRLTNGSFIHDLRMVSPTLLDYTQPSDWATALCANLGFVEPEPARETVYNFFVNAMQRARAEGAASVAPALASERANVLKELHAFATEIGKLYPADQDQKFGEVWNLATKRFIDYAEKGLGIRKKDSGSDKEAPDDEIEPKLELAENAEPEFEIGRRYLVQIAGQTELLLTSVTSLDKELGIVTFRSPLLFVPRSFFTKDLTIIKVYPVISTDGS
jgi:hypothetical protein